MIGKYKKVLIACIGDPCTDPRPRRKIIFLSNHGYEVDVLGCPSVIFLNINDLFPLRCTGGRFHEKLIWFAITKIRLSIGKLISADSFLNFLNELRYGLLVWRERLWKANYDLIVVEDIQLLSFAFRIKRDGKILFDAREYYPRQNEESIIFNFFERHERIKLCKKYLHLCDYTVTVSPGLAEAYLREFEVRFEVFRSLPDYRNIPVKTGEEKKIRMVHHGAANRNRNLDNMIKIVQQLDDRFTLDFYLTGSKGYINKLKKSARGCQRISFKVPVCFEQIIPMLSEYDIGIFYVEPTTFNLKHCLPNKLFEFIQARIAVAIGPSSDMANIIRKYNCGFISDEFSIDSMVKMLRLLDKDIVYKAKMNANLAAHELCFETEQRILVKLLNLEKND